MRHIAGSIAWLMLALMLAQPLRAEVYRWVDEDGVTHFGDQVPDGQKAKKMDIQAPAPSGRTRVGTGRHAYDPQKLRENEQRFLQMVEAERRAKEKRKAELAQQQAERAQQCKRLHNRLLSYREGIAMVRRNDQGEIEHIPDAEVQARHAQLEAQWQQNCSETPG